MEIELVTSRLLLRPFVDGDQAAVADLFADEAVRRHLAMASMGPKGPAHFAAGFIRGSQDEWREGGCGALAVTPRRATKDTAARGEERVIGYCGLRLLPDRISAVELLYALEQTHWGRGLAVEAANAVMDWGFANLPVREIVAFTRPEHGASRRVMEKLGLTHRGGTDRYYSETLAAYSLARAGGTGG
ncbi:MAG: GNAT family N-acetyltransferase [Alphaproteobacteria bacterium]|nr:GNAT family N-acetyltransferase [Alphaproteobacteria bacterium]MBL6954919.1 GNAT family N-acetyltransferase [Alphaproteobacteria bacterium]